MSRVVFVYQTELFSGQLDLGVLFCVKPLFVALQQDENYPLGLLSQHLIAVASTG